MRAARASEAKLATVSAERRRLEAQLHEQEVRRVAGGEAGDSEWAVHPTFPLHRQTDLSQLTSRADELGAATATLTKRRDALATQSAELAPRLSAMHLRLDGVHREIAGLAPLVASLQKTVDQRAATLSFLSSSRAAVDNVTIGLLIAAASARRDAYAIGQEVHALRHPAEEAALDQAAALAAAGASSADGPLLPLSDAQLLAARDASVLSLVGGDIARARKRRGPSERLFRFRALAEPAMTDEVDADPENTGATTVPPTAASATLRRGGPSGEGMRHVAAERDLRLTRQALDHAVEEGRRWLEDKRSVARSVLELKARMDDLSARVGRLRDASERGATALEDARDASEELAFQVALTTQEANSTSEANAAAEKEAAFLAAKRADVARKLEDVQQLRVTRVVDLRAAIRAKLDARRAAAAALGNLQRERLDLAQAVSGATERARLLESDVETSAAQLAGLQRRAAMLTQSQDVVTGELRAADARRLAAIEGAAPLAQRRKDLEDAAVAEAATRGRLQALVASGSAAVAAAQANLEHLTASRRAVASSLSTLQLKLGAAEEELSNTGAASLEAGLELDRLALRRKALDSEAVRLARQIEDARVSLARAEARQARASGNLSGLHERVKHFSAVRARILSNSAKVNASESSSPLPEATGRGAARGTVQ